MRLVHQGFILIVFVLCLGVCSAPIHAQDSFDSTYVKTAQPGKNMPEGYHSLKAGTIAGQVLLGASLGGLGGVLGGLAATRILQCSGNWCEFGEFFIGASIGYTFGSALGVYAVGNNSIRKASYPAVLLGDVIGFGLGLYVLDSLADGASGFQKYFIGASTFGLPLLGAILAYSLSQKPRIQNQSSLLNVSGGNLTLATPSVSGMDSSPLLQNQFITGISIINLGF